MRARWARSVTARSRSACTRSGSGARCRWAGRCICPRSGATRASGGRRRRSPRASCSRRIRGWPPGGLCEQAAGWEMPLAPVLADSAYGDDTAFRTNLHQSGLEYVVAVRAETSVYGPETSFAVPERNGTTGRPRTVARPDRKPESLRALAARLPARAWKTLPCRTTAAGEDVSSRFAFVRVVASHVVRTDCLPPRQEWLIIEWPPGHDAPSDYWLSNLAEDEPRERLARLARLRWTIELDYRQLKGELGLDHPSTAAASSPVDGRGGKADAETGLRSAPCAGSSPTSVSRSPYRRCGST